MTGFPWPALAAVSAAGGLVLTLSGAVAGWALRARQSGASAATAAAGVETIRRDLAAHLDEIKPKMIEFEEMKGLIRENGVQIGTLIKSVDRLIGLSDEHVTEHRQINGLLAKLAARLEIG